ncbi:hypothetical permease [Vibrio caribbeanicus ATCC BAA-2122]|uniref:Hypothetical permease n=2 Tax=Vibrio caribbeanicus TaxID=701175 RepID=E3BKB3_9VIBR|nr:hypothetical permease [Vibrio caribbeanicus ATCC BAA-2122]
MTEFITNNKRLMKWCLSEIKHGQLWLIVCSLVLIFACIFALAALATRIDTVFEIESKQLLTADLVYETTKPISPQLLRNVEIEEVTHSIQTRFATMAFSDSEMSLISVKAVDRSFPLKGDMVLFDGENRRDVVEPNELWLDKRLLSLLAVNIGDVVSIGDLDLNVSGVIEKEPGISFNPFQQMPSALISSADLKNTGAVQLGSRVHYRVFLTGPQDKLARLKQSIELTVHDRWRDFKSTNRANDIFSRAESYLTLTVVTVILMGALTLALTCQHYAQSRHKTVAMLKSLGANKKWILHWLMVQIGVLLLIAIFFGTLLGGGLEYLLRIPLQDLLPENLPAYGYTPFFTALLSTILIAIPSLGIPISRLISVKPANASQVYGNRRIQWSLMWLILVPFVPLFVWLRNDTVVWVLIAGFFLLFVVLSLVSLWTSKYLDKYQWFPSLKLALSRINRTKLNSGIQFGALSLSLMLLASLWLVRTDLLADWEKTLPADAPNAFAVNIAPQEIEQYINELNQARVEHSTPFPIIRGRVVEINGFEARQIVENAQDKDVLRRELSFTFGKQIPSYNSLSEGTWNSTKGVSVESKVAKDLGLEIGDSLTFSINSQKVTAIVNSIRTVEWRDMRPNFYFIFTPDVLEAMPKTFLMSFKVEDGDTQFFNDLSRKYPTVSVFDIRLIGEKVQAILAQIVWAITLLAIVSLIAGLLLIFTLLRLSLSQRREEIQLYRMLGASKAQILRTVWCEYGVLSLVGSSFALIGTEAVVACIVYIGFELQPTPHIWLWFSLPLLTFFVLALVVKSMLSELLTRTDRE